jgi:hypothetical protein
MVDRVGGSGFSVSLLCCDRGNALGRDYGWCLFGNDFWGNKRRNDAYTDATTALDCGSFIGGTMVGGECAGNIFIAMGTRS